MAPPISSNTETKQPDLEETPLIGVEQASKPLSLDRIERPVFDDWLSLSAPSVELAQNTSLDQKDLAEVEQRVESNKVDNRECLARRK